MILSIISCPWKTWCIVWHYFCSNPCISILCILARYRHHIKHINKGIDFILMMLFALNYFFYKLNVYYFAFASYVKIGGGGGVMHFILNQLRFLKKFDRSKLTVNHCLACVRTCEWLVTHQRSPTPMSSVDSLIF